jgi:IS5 family transposase
MVFPSLNLRNDELIKFLGFPECIPDRITIWSFKKRINDNFKENKILEQFQSQLDFFGLKIKTE